MNIFKCKIKIGTVRPVYYRWTFFFFLSSSLVFSVLRVEFHSCKISSFLFLHFSCKKKKQKKTFCWYRYFSIVSVGYTMRDIRYKWNQGPTSVGVSNEVSLPQFKVLGHRQRTVEISLSTGKPFFNTTIYLLYNVP